MEEEMAATPAESREAIRTLLSTRLGDGPGAEWLARHEGETDPEAVRKLMPEVARAVGRKALVAAFAERARAEVPGVWGALKVGDWRTDDAVRVLLLAHAAGAAAEPYGALHAAYDLGDTETRVAALRAVNFVAAGPPELALDMVLDAGRTYLNELLSAAWCNNPFSARHLSDHDYRKAVLKAFFVGVPVDGFLGLESRADETLTQSLNEYADERLAAGRPVPPAVWAVAAVHPRPGLVARLIGNLEHPSGDERLAAARALANARDARSLPFVTERLERETDEDVRAALQSARSRIEAS